MWVAQANGTDLTSWLYVGDLPTLSTWQVFQTAFVSHRNFCELQRVGTFPSTLGNIPSVLYIVSVEKPTEYYK